MGYSIEAVETYPDYFLEHKTEYVPKADGTMELVDHGLMPGPIELSPGELKFYEDMEAMRGYWYWLAIKRQRAAGTMRDAPNPFNPDPGREKALDEELFQKAKQKLVDRGIEVPVTPDEW